MSEAEENTATRRRLGWQSSIRTAKAGADMGGCKIGWLSQPPEPELFGDRHGESKELVHTPHDRLALDVLILLVNVSARGQSNAHSRNSPANWNVGIGTGGVARGNDPHRFQDCAGDSCDARVGGNLARGAN